MDEIIFYIEDAVDGGYIAKALNFSIYTQADDIEELRTNIIDSVKCHFDLSNIPKVMIFFNLKNNTKHIDPINDL